LVEGSYTTDDHEKLVLEILMKVLHNLMGAEKELDDLLKDTGHSDLGMEGVERNLLEKFHGIIPEAGQDQTMSPEP
jgi:hypothetical protein